MSEADPAAQAHDYRHYLARDYTSFRTLLLDQLDARLLGGVPRDAASLEVALVEVLAYVADYLSYYQDAVATEAYLGTARQRVSIARHAQLLGYQLDEGCSARTYVRLETRRDDVILPAGVQLITAIAGIDAVTVPTAYATDDRIVFQTLHPVRLWRAHNHIRLAGAAWRVGDTGTRLAGALPRLAPGDVLVLGHDGSWAHPVALTSVAPQADGTTDVTWHDDDALPTDLPDTPPGDPAWRVLGNIALAQHGRSAALRLPRFACGEATELTLDCGELSFACPPAPGRAATAALAQDPRTAQPMLELVELPRRALAARAPGLAATRGTWSGCRSLIDAGPCDRRVAVEPIDAEIVRLRFGDGAHGRRPLADFDYVAVVRIGRGTRGNIGPGTLAHIVSRNPDIVAVTNPMAAVGGTDPEPIEDARALAQVASFGQARCVTAADYEAAALAFADVRAARAERGDDGAVAITVVRVGDQSIDDGFRARMMARIAPLALIGDRLAIFGASYVVPTITLELAVARGHRPATVRAAVAARLVDGLAMTFGEALEPARVIAEVRAVAGVADAVLVALMRDGDAVEAVGPITVDGEEIVRIDPKRLTIMTPGFAGIMR